MESKNPLAVDPRPPLIKGIGQMGTVYADAAYMFQECFDAIDEKGGTSLARDPTLGLKQRNRIVQELWDSSKKLGSKGQNIVVEVW